MSRGARLLHGLFLFGSALWCGALAAFAGAAGLVLASAPSRHAGGAVNRALLDALDVASLVFSGILLAVLLALDSSEPWRKLRKGLAIRLLVVAALATVVSAYIITPEMMALRDRMPTLIDLVPKSDPLRQAWGRLHGLSSISLVVRIAATAALFAVGLSPFRYGPSQPPSQT
jgi:hypothetical protein